MADLPIMLRVAGSRCLIVGGGAVALRRATALLQADAVVTVIAPQVTPELAALPVMVHRRAYQTGDVAGSLLVVAASDDPAVNQQVAQEAQAAGILVNRADDPAGGNVSVPAHAHHGPVTLAVYTGGISAGAAATIRRSLSASLDPDWPRLLEVVAPYRQAIQKAIADRDEDAGSRNDRDKHSQGGYSGRLLRQLTDQRAMETFKQGGQAALRQHCQRLLAAAREHD